MCSYGLLHEKAKDNCIFQIQKYWAVCIYPGLFELTNYLLSYIMKFFICLQTGH